VTRLLLDRMNRFDATLAHAHALSALQIPFDSTEAVVGNPAVSLPAYRLIDVALGEESTADDTLNDAEQAALSAWLDSGGARTLMVSGAELAWDLGAQGTASDQAFLARLGAAFESDDAGTYTLTSELVEGTLLLDDGGVAFQGSNGVEFPDTLTPVQSEVVLRYDDGRVAGVRRSEGATTALTFGVPLESLFPDARREVFFGSLLEEVEVVRLEATCDGPIEPGPEAEAEPEPGPENTEPGAEVAEVADVVESGASNRPTREVISRVRETGGCAAGGVATFSLWLLLAGLVVGPRRLGAMRARAGSGPGRSKGAH
ncbi:MAG TPA: hypothetical protein PK095_25095, partial [Myxococcota bacterium]|nr:hypothetical protein [Myxococcota bacterium]